MNLQQTIQQLARGSAPLHSMVCRVTEVDKTNRTICAQPLDESAPLLDVNLQANQASTIGLVAFPRKDSYVVVGFMSEGAAACVLLMDDIEEMSLIIKDTDTAAITINEKGICIDAKQITFNGGGNHGMVLIEELTQKLNRLVGKVNSLISGYTCSKQQLIIKVFQNSLPKYVSGATVS